MVEKHKGMKRNCAQFHHQKEIGTAGPAEASGELGKIFQRWQRTLLDHFREKLNQYCLELEDHYPSSNDEDQEFAFVSFASWQSYYLQDFHKVQSLFPIVSLTPHPQELHSCKPS